MQTACSRREFFGQAPAGAVAALTAAEPPPQAWIILQADWEFNDEYSDADGEIAQSTLYYDRAAAEAECRRLNDEFYAHETPEEFQLDWALYFPDDWPDGKSEADITWDDVKASGRWAEPFRIHELTIPGVSIHE